MPVTTVFQAVSIAEGFCGGEDASEEQQVEAWQFLIDTEYVWKLQGWFARTALNLIEQGICTHATIGQLLHNT